jgi:predicted nucleic acid-binding protein
MRYLLDTNLCIYIAKQKPHGVLARLQHLSPHFQFELYF